MKRLIVVILLIILSVSCFSCWIGDPLLKYSNSKYNYTIYHPCQWDVYEHENKSQVEIIAPRQYLGAIEIMAFNENLVSPKGTANLVIDVLSEVHTDFAVTDGKSIYGNDWYYSWVGDFKNNWCSGVAYYVQYPDVFFRIEVYADEYLISKLSVSLDDIVNTFKYSGKQ